jgi:hypothetical protein
VAVNAKVDAAAATRRVLGKAWRARTRGAAPAHVEVMLAAGDREDRKASRELENLQARRGDVLR